MIGDLFIGTSGFYFTDWIEKFYPEDLSSNQWLEYYSQKFSSLELNNTFYRVPGPKTFVNWYQRTPRKFIFSVKVNQGITHGSKLRIEPDRWDYFWQRISVLKDKLGVLLFQLAPMFKKDISALSDFLAKYKMPINYAFEFRHLSWFDDEVLRVLKAYGCASVFSDLDNLSFPLSTITANFVYIRLHGKSATHDYDYSRQELGEWAEKAKQWLAEGLDVFIYFNNDQNAFAVKNASEMTKLLLI